MKVMARVLTFGRRLLVLAVCFLPAATYAQDDSCWAEAVKLFTSYRQAVETEASTAPYFNVRFISDLMKNEANVQDRDERIQRMVQFTLSIDTLQSSINNPTSAYVRCGTTSDGSKYGLAVFKATLRDAQKTPGFIEVSILGGKLTNVALVVSPKELDGAQDLGVPFQQLNYRTIP